MNMLLASEEDQQFPGPDFYYYSAAVMTVSAKGVYCCAYAVWALDPKDAVERVLQRVLPELFEEGPVYVNIWSPRAGTYSEVVTMPRPKTYPPATNATVKLTED